MKKRNKRACLQTLLFLHHATYSLISFSLSKGLLGFLDVFLSGEEQKLLVSMCEIKGRQSVCSVLAERAQRTRYHLQFVYFLGIWKD